MTKFVGEKYNPVLTGEDFVSFGRGFLLYDLYFIVGGCVSEPVLEGTSLSDSRISLLELSIQCGIVYYRKGN